MGADAAIFYGYHLEVDTVWAFGPIVFHEAQFDHPKAKLEATSPPLIDLPRLLATGNGRTTYRIYYAEDYPEDRRAAESFAACPGVELHPQQGDSHNIVRHLADSGRLHTLLQDINPPRP
jgi:hypothetical protein